MIEMKTYGLTKDFRVILYIIVLAASIVIFCLIDYLLICKIQVPDLYYFGTKIILSLFSYSLINTVIIFIINAFYVKKNKYNGKYKIELISSFEGKTFTGELQIKVSLQYAKISLQTENSYSESATVYIDNSDKERKVITYTYLNRGNENDANKLSMHTGTCLLIFEKGVLSGGRYYNDGQRNTYGEIKVLK